MERKVSVECFYCLELDLIISGTQRLLWGTYDLTALTQTGISFTT